MSTSSEPVKIGIVGLGTVGTGVVRLLIESCDHITRHVGRNLVVERVVVRDESLSRQVTLPKGMVTSDLSQITEDPSITVAALLVGGLEPARSIMIELLERGKDVVTANKALLAEHGPELFALARRKGRSIAFEAAVAGGIPIVATIAQCLSANRIEAVRGILNGTSNFILAHMEEEGASYSESLAMAQKLGFAEADPSMDVDGTDATQKLAILIQLAFGIWIPWREIPRTGIEAIHAVHIARAAEMGYRIRLVASASRAENALTMRLEPMLVRQGSPLAEVRGAFNAVEIKGDAVGRIFFHGQGAGQMPTASAVVADIIDTVVGRAAITFDTTGRMIDTHARSKEPLQSDPMNRHFLHLLVRDEPGVLADITGILGTHGISIASVIQQEPTELGAGVPLVIMTHYARQASLRLAMQEIDSRPTVTAPSTCLSVLDELDAPRHSVRESN